MSRNTRLDHLSSEDVFFTRILKELRDFCEKMFDQKNKQATKLELKRKLAQSLGQVLVELCERVVVELDTEPNIVETESVCYVFGDIHGNLQDIYDYEKLFWGSFQPNANYMFIGDFVDRGEYSVEVVVYLFCLKMLFPQQFCLIRGNHEIREINKDYTFLKECQTKYGCEQGNMVYNKFNICFESLPLAALIDKSIFCCHGGVPKGGKYPISYREIMDVPKPLVDPNKDSQIAQTMLWNDPIESRASFNDSTEDELRSKGIEFVPNRARLTGWYFTAQAAKKFLKSNGWSYMIRAHEAVQKGYRLTSGERVITIFSSSNYNGMRNTTACVRVDLKTIQIILIKIPPQINHISHIKEDSRFEVRQSKYRKPKSWIKIGPIFANNITDSDKSFDIEIYESIDKYFAFN